MLILGTEEHFDPPCPARVVAVVRGHGQWLRRYVLLEVEDPDGSRRDVVATLRTRRRWRRPRRGEWLETLVWEVAPRRSELRDGYMPPARGTGIFWLTDGDLAAERERHVRRHGRSHW